MSIHHLNDKFLHPLECFSILLVLVYSKQFPYLFTGFSTMLAFEDFIFQVETGNYEELVHLLDELDARGTIYGTYPLKGAVASANEDIACLLLNQRVGGNYHRGDTALLIAAESGHDKVVELLLDRGANIDKKDYLGMTALMIAAESGHDKVVELLLDRGAHIDEEDIFGGTVLIYAASMNIGYQNGIEILQLLLRRGATVDKKDKSGRTPLICAAVSGQENVVELLLAKGASVNEKDRKGCTALMYAAGEPFQANVVELLLDKGANVDEKDNFGKHALFHATKYFWKEKVVRHLLHRGANVNVLDKEGNTLLHKIAEFDSSISSIRGILFLIYHGVDSTVRNNKGMMPLDVAVQRGNWKVAEAIRCTQT